MPELIDRVLIIDDDANLLAGLRRMLGQLFSVTVAEGGEAGLETATRHGPFAVVVCDMRMPGLDGVQVLQRLQQISPDTVRIMLTGNADQQTAIAAINDGQIFRFYNKPCSLKVLGEGIAAALRQYRLVTAERSLLEGTLAGAVGLMNEVLSLAAPDSFERSLRLRAWALRLGRHLKLDSVWDVELAAALARIGEIAIPPDVLARQRAGQSLSALEADMLAQIPDIGANLIRRIPRMEPVAQGILYQAKWFSGDGTPQGGMRGADIPLAGRILHILLALDETGHGQPTRSAFRELDKMTGRFDPQLLRDAALSLEGLLVDEAAFVRLSLPAKALLPGDVLESHLQTDTGKLILAAGQTLSDTLYVRLHNMVQIYRFQEPVRVRRTGL